MAADPNFGNVILLANLDSAGPRNAATNYPIPTAGTAVFSSSGGKFGGCWTTGTNGEIAPGGTVDAALRTDDFTIEFWVNPTNVAPTATYGRILQTGANTSLGGLFLFRTLFSNPTDMGLELGTGSGYVRPLGTGSLGILPNSTWSHVAITRQSGVWRIFVNGVKQAEATYTGVGNDLIQSSLKFGRNEVNAEQFNGSYDDIRVTRGLCRYSADFTPPTTAFEPAAFPYDFQAKFVSARVSGVPGYNLEPQSPRRRLWAKGGTWRWETQTTGSGTISGIVTIENIPGSRKVRLYRKHDGMLLRETWSAPNGAYSFSNLDPAWEYFVVAHDHLRVYNGVIQDMITP